MGGGGEETEHRSHVISTVATQGSMSLTVTVSFTVVNNVHCISYFPPQLTGKLCVCGVRLGLAVVWWGPSDPLLCWRQQCPEEERPLGGALSVTRSTSIIDF